MDGSIRVGTKIDTSGAEKDLNRLQKECEKTADAIQNAGEKLKTTFTGMSAKQLEKSLEKVNKELQKTLELQAQVEAEGQAVSDSYKPMYDKATSDEQRGRIDEMAEAELEPINAKWAELNAKAEEYRQQIAAIEAELRAQTQAEFEKNGAVEQGAEAREKEAAATKKSTRETAKLQSAATKASRQITREINRGIKRILRLSIAVMGVESAFTILRRATNAAMSDNEKLSNQLNAIWNVLGTAITPVIETLVKWLTTAITYINAFVYALAGIDYIAKSNANALKKQTDATNAAVKASKQLAGFDEMNKLSSNTDTSSSASSGIFTPDASIDISAVEIFVQKVQELLPLILGIGSGLATWKILSDIGLSFKTCAGWALIIAGAVTAISAGIDAWKNGLDWENLAEMIGGIALAVTGLALAFGKVGAAIGLIVGGLSLVVLGFKDWLENGESLEALTAIEVGILAIGAAIALLTGSWIPLAIAAIAGLVIAFLMYGDEIHAWLDGAGEWCATFFDDIAKKVENFFLNLGKWFEQGGALCHILSMAIIAIGDVVGIVIRLIGDAFNVILKVVGAVVKTISAIATGDWEGAWKAWADAFMSIWELILNFLKGIVNIFIDIINVLIRGLNKISVDIPDWVPKFGGQKFGISIKEIPRLAQGGIVNNPGRGVPVIAGESGAEAVLPLENNTGWMDILADKINGGERSIVVQVMLSGKKIHEEIIKLSQRRNFATNGVI